MTDEQINAYTDAYMEGYKKAAVEYTNIYYPSVKFGKTMLEQLRADVEMMVGEEIEVGNLNGDRFKYEQIYKSDVLDIIDRFIGYMEESHDN